jgi:glutamyl-tRNA reductase
LEAQVLGDMQISNQVKRAYQASADENVAGPFLHRLMHTIFFTGKRVAQETSLRDGAASVSYAATDLALNLAAEIAQPKALVIGMGEIGADVCRNLRDSNSKPIAATDIFISNRTQEKAEALAAECGFQTVPFEEVAQYIEQVDVVISALTLPQPLITKDLLAKHELLRYKYFIDLSVPRSVEEGVENIPGALVYHIDDIKSKVDEALSKRLAAIPQVEAIIEEALTDLKNWAQEMEVSPTIKKLKNTLEQIRQEEMARHLKNLSTEETQRLEAVTKGMMQKIIKLPVLQLKAACKRGEAETLIDVLNDLFDLERQPIKAEKK